MRRNLAVAYLALLFSLAIQVPGSPLGLQFPMGSVGPFGGGASVTPMFVTGALTGTTVNGATNTALGTQTFTGGGACATNTYCLWIPYGNLAGNAIQVTVFYASSPATTISVTTDKAQSLTSVVTSAAQSSKIGQVFVLCGATTGTQELKIAASTGVIVYDAFVSEWAGVPTSGCVDTSASTIGASATAATGGTLTPTNTNEILSTYVLRAGTPACTSNPCFTVGTNTGITWALRGADYSDGGGAFQWGTDSQNVSITPAMTLATASTYIGLTVAFNTSTSAGTDPTGMYPAYAMSCDTPATAGATQNCQFPSIGNLLVAQQNCGGLDVTGITDSGNTGWIQPGWRSDQLVASSTISSLWYRAGAAADGSGAVQFALTGTDDCTFKMYDFVGADNTRPFANRLEGPNTNNTNQTVVINSTFYPGASSGWVLSASSQHTNTAGAVTSPTGALFQSTTWGGQNSDGPSKPNQNNFWGLYQSSSTSTQNWTYTNINTAENEGEYGAEIASFAAPSATFANPSIIQSPYHEVTSGSTDTVTLNTSTLSGTVLIALVGSFNATGRTVSKVCTDGTTCAAGHSFTRATSATASLSGGNEVEIWYCLSCTSGVSSVEATYSGTITNGEMKVLEVRNLTTFDVANHVNNATGSAGATDTGASVTPTSGHVALIVSITAVASATIGSPDVGNAFGYDNVIFNNTKDTTGALIVSASGSSYAFASTDQGASGSFCNGTASFF